MKRQIGFFLVLAVFALSLPAQSLSTKRWRKSEKDSMERAQAFYDDKLLDLALPIFLNLQKAHPNEQYLQYITGVCALDRSDLHGLSLQLLQQVYVKNKKIPDIDYYLARALHLNYKFDESLAMLDAYKAKNKKLTAKQKDDIERLVVYCTNAKILVANPLPAKIENLGRPPNTEASEYVPVLSADEETLVYTYVGDSSTGGRQNAYNEPDAYGRFYEDVFITKKRDGAWQYGKSIGTTINTKENDAAVSLSQDGQMLFIFKDDRTNGGDLYVSYLQGNEWTFPSNLRGDVNKIGSWEGSCSLSSDGKTLYFASDRKGGYGGRDLYVATKMPDGSWGNVKNLGDKINTKYDDDAPFIHPDGRLLIFGSMGGNSMGSYDIFKTMYNPADSSWSVPENLGYPINSPDRDLYYVLSASGEHGYYSSGKEGGQGLQDIYMVTPGLKDYKPALLLVKGTVTLNGQPVEAELIVDIAGNANTFTNLKSNATDGKYLVSLPAGNDYKLSFKLKDYPDKVVDVPAAKLSGYTERVINVEFAGATTPLVKTDEPKKDTVVVTVTTPTVSSEVPEVKKDEKIEGLFFRVQIAAYKFPQNYDGSHLKGLGKIEKLHLDDGIYRITIGGDFFTLSSAQMHRAKVKAAGQHDVFITAVYKGRRVYMDELYKMGLIGQFRNK